MCVGTGHVGSVGLYTPAHLIIFFFLSWSVNQQSALELVYGISSDLEELSSKEV